MSAPTWIRRVPTYFLVALGVHLLLGGLSFTVYLGGDIVARVQQQMREMLVFTHVSHEALARSRNSTASAPPSLGAADEIPLETPQTDGVQRAVLDPLAAGQLPQTTMPAPALTTPRPDSYLLPLSSDVVSPEAPDSPAPLALSPPSLAVLLEESVPLEAVTSRPASMAEVASTPLAIEKQTLANETPGEFSPVEELAPSAIRFAPTGDIGLPYAPPTEHPASTGDVILSLRPRLEDAVADAIPLDGAPPAEATPLPIAEIAALAVPLERAPAVVAATPPQIASDAATRPSSGAASAALVQADLAPPLATAAALPASPASFGPKAARRLVAEDNIGLTALLQLRQGPAKRDAVEAFGGNQQTQEAVRRGLDWLARHQHADGYWSLHEFHKQCQGHECQHRGQVKSDAAATGFALMAFLGDGHSHQQGDYQDTVKRGVLWLITQQNDKGDLAPASGGNTHMYSHGIATIAICEAFALTKDEQLRGAAQQAVAFIVSAQHAETGGWRYEPNQPADTSVVGWQVMALKSAQMAGLDVPQHTMQNVRKWLTRVERQGKERGRFGYQSPDNSVAMTAEALLCLEYIGVPRDDPSLVGGINFLLERLPKQSEANSYYWYYGTQAMYHAGGEPWQKWNGALRDLLINTQAKDGHHAGTWDVHDSWEQQGGRIYATCLRILMLETYYRHLPLY